jgi:hypothetical protein
MIARHKRQAYICETCIAAPAVFSQGRPLVEQTIILSSLPFLLLSGDIGSSDEVGRSPYRTTRQHCWSRVEPRCKVANADCASWPGVRGFGKRHRSGSRSLTGFFTPLFRPASIADSSHRLSSSRIMLGTLAFCSRQYVHENTSNFYRVAYTP